MNKVELLKLGLSQEEKKEFESDIVANKKKINNVLSEARKSSKGEKCLYCGKETTSFCNSHSIPAFCLRNIATNGTVFHSNTFVDLPLLDFDKGVNKAGTFQLICRECDSVIFKQYEEPSNYENKPTPQMIAEIAMKNYLKAISKRVNEHAIFDKVKEHKFEAIGFANYMQEIQNTDLNEYKKGYEKAKRLSKKNKSGEYYLFFYEKLNYVVPIAFQSSLALVVDLEGQIVNDIYYKNPRYRIEDFHICVFPLKENSVIMMFVDSNNKRYRNFYKKFNRLTLEEKLSIVNYIIFLYSEDIFLSKQIPQDILNDENLKNVSKQTSMALVANQFGNAIEEAKNVYDLSKHNTIPNLLSEKYKLR